MLKVLLRIILLALIVSLCGCGLYISQSSPLVISNSTFINARQTISSGMSATRPNNYFSLKSSKQENAKIKKSKSIIDANWNYSYRGKEIKQLDEMVLSKVKVSKKINFKEINNTELIRLTGYKTSTIKEFEVLSLLDNKKIFNNKNLLGMLAALEKKESEGSIAKATKGIEVNIANNATKDPLVEIESVQESIVTPEVNAETIATEKMPFSDELKTLQSSVSKNIAADDLLLVDLSKEEDLKQDPLDTISNLSATRHNVSASVTEVIQREMKLSQNMTPRRGPKREKATSAQKTAQRSKDDYSPDYSQSMAFNDGGPSEKIDGQSAGGNRPKSQYISAIEVKIGKGISEDVHNFDFIPNYDKNERLEDDGEGKVYIDEKLASGMSVLKGAVVKKDKVRTNIEIVLDGKRSEIVVPLLDQQELSEFIESNNLKAVGGLVLLELGEKVQSADLDASYEARFFLDDQFKVVKDEENSSFILFLGVEPGNSMISYLSQNGKVAQKVVFIAEDEIYFEASSIKGEEVISFNLFENNLLGDKNAELVIDDEKINYFNTKKQARNLGANRYEISKPMLPTGMRKYIELKHLNASLFLGFTDNNNLLVPSNDFVVHVFDRFKITELYDRCMIQLNLFKSPTTFKADGSTDDSGMNIESKVLDKDGSFSEEVTDAAKNIFLLGDKQGEVSIKVDYVDGTTEHLRTYCSKNTYIVEQL